MIRPEGLFVSRPAQTWGLIFLICMYLVFCWGLYTIAVEPLYEAANPPTIGADSSAYFDAADDLTKPQTSSATRLSLGGSTLGPGIVGLIFRTPFGVAWFNCALFALTIWWAGRIPGVNRVYFSMLMAVEPQTLPTLMTLNKEMMAIAGLVSFGAYIYGGQERGKRRGSLFFLLVALILSFMGRWQQILILFWYLAMEARWSPFRGKPWRSVWTLLLFISIGWVTALKLLHINLGGFVATVEGGNGMAARLYAVQAKGGFFLIALPKIIMYLAGRWVTPTYFLNDYWTEDWNNSWQNQYIGILGSLYMVLALAYIIMRGRFRLGRPLIYLTLLYYICTATNPFIQPRYVYPAYVLLALEMSRKKDTLEPVKPAWKPPALPPSYRVLPPGTVPRAG